MRDRVISSFAIVFGLLTILPTGKALADSDRWYATANVGLGELSSATLTYSDGDSEGSSESSFDASFAGGATVGYQVNERFAIEGEIMYRRNEFGATELPGLGESTEGDFASLALGINALYRFPIGDSGKLSGYVGPGYVYLQEIDIDFDSDGQQAVSFETDDSALQFKFGGRYQASDRWFVEAGATYLGADSVRMELPASPTETLQSDYEHWTLSVAVGLTF